MVECAGKVGLAPELALVVGGVTETETGVRGSDIMIKSEFIQNKCSLKSTYFLLSRLLFDIPMIFCLPLFTVSCFDKVPHSTGRRRSSEYPPRVGHERNDR